MVRIGRINSEMQKSLSVTINSKVKDPRVSGMITITSVECAKDLKTAKVFVSIFGGSDEDKQASMAALNSAQGFIRSELARDLKSLRTVPQLTFLMDESIAYGEKIDNILDEIKKSEKSEES